jgi:Omp85 superfamily domain
MSCVRCPLLLLLCLFFALPVSAQTTRVEAIAQEQAKKAKALKPEQPGRAEQVVVRIMSSIGRTPEGPYPWMGDIFPGGWMAGGVGYARSLPRGSRINLVGGISFKAYKLLSAEFAPMEMFRGRLKTSFGVQWIDAPGVAFYGLGPDSQKLRSQYGYRPTTARANASFKLAPFTTVEGGYQFLHSVTDRGEDLIIRFKPEQVPGLNQKLNYDVGTIGFKFDTRPSSGYSTRGVLARGQWFYYNERDDKPFSFSGSEYEAGVLIPILREQFGFMFRGLATIDTPKAGSSVPIVFAPTVGSGSTVRGFSDRRFQDNSRLVINSEYRWRPSRYLDMAVFYDLGQVAPNWGAIEQKKFEKSWGVGARFHGPTFTVLRMEVARTREGWGLIFASSFF